MKLFLEFVNLLPKKHKMIKVLVHRNDEVLISRGPDNNVYFTYDQVTEKAAPSKTKDREAIRLGKKFLESINSNKGGSKLNRGKIISKSQKGPARGGYFK